MISPPRMNPFYLEGDFNGDGALDVAVLIKERGTGKHGIAVVHLRIRTKLTSNQNISAALMMLFSLI